MAKGIKMIKAQELRAQGESIKVIAKLLHVSVGSVSSWCKNVQLTADQIQRLQIRAKDPNYGKRLEYSQKQQRIKNQKIEQLKLLGIKEVGSLTERELFLIGVALYWAEGFKKDKQVGFANSDPLMIKLFILWLTKCFNYEISDLSFRVSTNFSHEYRILEIERYWAEVIGIETNFSKPFYQKVKWAKIYTNPNDYYGVLRIRVRKSLDFLRTIHGYIEGLKLNTI